MQTVLYIAVAFSLMIAFALAYERWSRRRLFKSFEKTFDFVEKLLSDDSPFKGPELKEVIDSSEELKKSLERWTDETGSPSEIFSSAISKYIISERQDYLLEMERLMDYEPKGSWTESDIEKLQELKARAKQLSLRLRKIDPALGS